MTATNDALSKELLARAVGEYVVNHLDALVQEALADLAERQAVTVLRQVKAVLDDESLDDAGCALRIDAIVQAFYDAGLSTSRHWEWE